MIKKDSSTNSKISEDDKNFAVLVHLSGFLGYVIPLSNIIIPLAIWLIKKEKSPFVASHAKEVLNFQITFFVYYILAFLAIFVLIGIPALVILFIITIILMVKGAIAASERSFYKYPATFRVF